MYGNWFCKPSGAIGGIDSHILGCEIAGPETSGVVARMEINYQQNVWLQQPIAGGALVEFQRLASAQNSDAGHLNVHFVWIELHAGAACRGENAAPVWITSRESSFHQRRSGDGLSDFARAHLSSGAANKYFYDPLRSFTISYDLQSERVANFFQRFRKVAMGSGTSVNRRGARCAIRKHKKSVIRGRVTINADGVECA